jgi:hypothetical protein
MSSRPCKARTSKSLPASSYLIIVTQLPGGASLARTDEVNRRVAEIAFQVPGIAHAVNLYRLHNGVNRVYSDKVRRLPGQAVFLH